MKPSAKISFPVTLNFCSTCWEDVILLEILLSSSIPDDVHPFKGLDHECDDVNVDIP